MYILYRLYGRNFALHSPKRLESIPIFGMDRRSVMIIRVKVNSNLELVEDREGKSALCVLICCCDDRLMSRTVTCGHTV